MKVPQAPEPPHPALSPLGRGTAQAACFCLSPQGERSLRCRGFGILTGLILPIGAGEEGQMQ